MRCSSCLCVPAVLAKLSLVVLLMAVDVISSENSDNDLTTSFDSQSSSRHKRAPGWGKRSGTTEDLFDDSENDQAFMDRVNALKRAPGWGKRFSGFSYGIDGGKVSQDIDQDEEGTEKRAPGWGKRAPGWGKRAPGWGKRAPGWGKRAPGWGKRAPGWGKRSGANYCETLKKAVDAYIFSAVEIESERVENCGSGDEVNEPFRK